MKVCPECGGTHIAEVLREENLRYISERDDAGNPIKYGPKTQVVGSERVIGHICMDCTERQLKERMKTGYARSTSSRVVVGTDPDQFLQGTSYLRVLVPFFYL